MNTAFHIERAVQSAKEESMDWRKELEKTAGVTDEGNTADLTDMEGREYLTQMHLKHLRESGKGSPENMDAAGMKTHV